MYDKILLPIDGTGASETVVEHALEIAGLREATVHLLHVVDDRAFLTLDDERIPTVTDELRTEGKQVLESAAERIRDDGIAATTGLRQGNPADEIDSYAADHDVDLVVMGSHGGNPQRNFLGSVSQKVVTLSPSPVLVVDLSAE